MNGKQVDVWFSRFKVSINLIFYYYVNSFTLLKLLKYFFINFFCKKKIEWDRVDDNVARRVLENHTLYTSKSG